MTPVQVFKAAALRELAAAGVGPARAADLVKAASVGSVIGGAAAGAGSLLGRLVSTFGPMAALGLVAAPVAAGAAGGKLLAAARDDDSDLAETQSDETIAAYRQLADEARRRAARKGLRLPEAE